MFARFISMLIVFAFTVNFAAAKNSEQLSLILDNHFGENINIIKTPRGMLASFPQKLIFCPNSLKLSGNGMEILNRVGFILSNIENECTIEGHSKNYKKLEAFEASIVKSDIVAEYLIKCYPKLYDKIFSVGLGDFDPQNRLFGNNNLEERIDIMFFAYEFKR